MKKKEFVSISMNMERSVHEKLVLFAEGHGMTKTKAVEILLFEALKNREAKERDKV